MKRYKKYMSGVNAPDTLHQRLLELNAPEKRPTPWAKYGSIAAALILAVGVGVWGLRGGFPFAAPHDTPLNVTAEVADAPLPDIAPEDPGAAIEPGEQTLGGYEVVSGSGPEAMVSYYILPYIEYGDASGQTAALDWDIPPEAARRDLTQDEIIALMGGEEAVNTHLDWGEYDLSGWGAWYEDGSFWGAYINGSLIFFGLGTADQFEFAVTADQLPPTCFGYPNSVTEEVRGLTVTADKSDWTTAFEDGRTLYHSERRVSFMKDGYGYRFEMTSSDSEQAELLVSRLVRQIADEGLALWTVDENLKTYTCEICGRTLLVGSGLHVHTYVDVSGSASTEPYDPSEAADPSYDAPGTYICGTCGESVREGGVHFHMILNGDGTYTCDSCGVTLPEGERHYHTADDGMCSGYPVPGPAESWQVCALPLAPSGAATETICD